MRPLTQGDEARLNLLTVIQKIKQLVEKLSFQRSRAIGKYH